MDTLSLARGTAAPASADPVAVTSTLRVADDKAMLRAAADLTRDLVKPKPAIVAREALLSGLMLARTVVTEGSAAAQLSSSATMALA